MITITAHGRLAFQPELKLLGSGSSVCEFRLLTTRYSNQKEHTEAVTFFCFGDMAEEFCSTTVKGQEISATGTQETQEYTPADGKTVKYVKYRLTWFSRGRKPYTGERSTDNRDASQNRDGAQDRGSYRQGSNARAPQAPQPPQGNRSQGTGNRPSPQGQPSRQRDEGFLDGPGAESDHQFL